jgi:hypothetical protein
VKTISRILRRQKPFLPDVSRAKIPACRLYDVDR